MPDPIVSPEPSGASARPGALVVDFKHITLVAVLLAGGAGTSGLLANAGSNEVAAGLNALQLKIGELAISLEQIKGELRSEKENHAALGRSLEDHEARLRALEKSAAGRAPK